MRDEADQEEREREMPPRCWESPVITQAAVSEAPLLPRRHFAEHVSVAELRSDTSAEAPLLKGQPEGKKSSAGWSDTCQVQQAPLGGTLMPLKPRLPGPEEGSSWGTAVASTDWKRQENGSKHNTGQYPGKELVVRRGVPFLTTVTFSAAPPAGSSITFTVERGRTSALQAKTRQAFGVSSAPPSGSWGAVQASATSNSVTFSIVSPVTAAIGRYQLSLKNSSGSSTSLGTFVLLFNPWLSGDDVFMPNNAEREEYVLSEFGVVFAGSTNRISSFGWNYGQFQDDILEISLSLLDRSLSYRKDAAADLSRRNDPKYVGRVLSAMVNSNDDSGVLQGNWSGDYSGGASPSSWTGSVDILRKWKSSGFKPVRFGQCWVFAGVLTTVLRCLGIPTRTISNFNSAHDADRTLTVDTYYDTAGNPLNRGVDSVWNFHVWNEGWFARPDLGAKYNGWQILDATPQERSTGIFQCGPASLTAIKEGDVDLDYDCPFVYAEVNADQVTWMYNTTTEEKKQLYSETKSIGQFTSTKALGSYARQDVTNNYKYPEGSSEERKVFEKAREKLKLRGFVATAAKLPPKPSVSGKFKVGDTPKVGEDVSLVLVLTNQAAEQKSVTANLTAWSIVYSGTRVHEVWKNNLEVTLAAEEEKTFPIKISYAEYEQQLTPDNTIRTTALCKVTGGSDSVVETDITLSNPSISMKVLGPVKVNQKGTVEVTFTNPLNQELNNCVLQAEGSDLLEDKLRLESPPLKAKETSKLQFQITPSKSGTKQLLINFSCDKFQDIKNFETIQVSD
ncbi:protein-glutamine gamma-glutamyltransferase E-like [Tiliqua scincoides]|uniref:protein-glutamine gamma-glutamyltransferase E-like n=1 Tax=Tiliqua scincoides TaxID=71010 RepID=UPI003462B4BA